VLIQGRPGTGRTTIVQKVMQAAMERGLDVEAYHCALDPQRIDHVVIPELSIAVMNASEPHTYEAG
jgi:nucleoside-triphosphatase THEP1